MKRTNPGPILVVALAMWLTTLAACTDRDPPSVEIPTASSSLPAPTPSSPSPTPSATPLTAAEAKQQALVAYMGMQTAFAAAGKISDPDYPDLRKFTAGAALDLFTTALTQRRKEGILSRGETVNHAKVTAVSPAKAPTKAVVEDCMDTSKTELYRATGGPVSQDKGGFRLALANLELANDSWKVTDLAVRGVGSCKP